MKKLFFIFFIFLFFPTIIKANNVEFVMDMESERILYNENGFSSRLCASTSKIMTSLIVLENVNLNKKVTVNNEIDKVYGSSMYLKKGEILTYKDLVYGLLLRSGNDAAITLATNIKNEKYFVSLMNKKAKELNLKQTHYENPHGLDNENENVMSAYDLAILTKYAMENKTFKKIIATKKYSFKSNLNNYTLYNKNLLLSNYKYTTGGKTGYTSKAGYLFVSTAKKNNLHLVIVTMGDKNRFNRHKALYEKCFNEYKRYKVLDKYTFKINKKNKYYKHRLYIKHNFYLPLTLEEKENATLDIVLKNKENFKNNSIIGWAYVKYKNKVLGKTPIYISKKNIFEKLKNLFN